MASLTSIPKSLLSCLEHQKSFCECTHESVHTSNSSAIRYLKIVALISRSPGTPRASHSPLDLMSGTLWTAISLFKGKKVKAHRKPQQSQDFHYNSKEELPATAVSSVAGILSEPPAPVKKKLCQRGGGGHK